MPSALMADPKKTTKKTPKKGTPDVSANEAPTDGGKEGFLSTRLYEGSSKSLAELARLEGLDSSADAFEKFFRPRLDALLTAAMKRRLDQIQKSAKPDLFATEDPLAE